MALDYVALGILIAVVVIIFYGIIAIHDIPYEIACKRDHPHRDAIHVAGWVSLFTLHVIWPFLWIWATLYREDRGWGFSSADAKSGTPKEVVLELQTQVSALEADVNLLKEKLFDSNRDTQDQTSRENG